jgi:hypothetical protein
MILLKNYSSLCEGEDRFQEEVTPGLVELGGGNCRPAIYTTSLARALKATLNDDGCGRKEHVMISVMNRRRVDWAASYIFFSYSNTADNKNDY